MGATLNIIGISALYHDSAACLIQNGRIVAAAEEERFTRKKHDGSMPIHAFRYCLEAGGITIDELDAVAYYEDSTKKLGRQIYMMLEADSFAGAHSAKDLDAGKAEWLIRNILGWSGTIFNFEHHLSHAASAYYFSGFKDASILTVDGVGEWTTASFGVAKGSTIELIKEIEYPNSLGLLYSAMTSYLGFSVNDAEYKVMGLAPYGTPRFKAEIEKLIKVDETSGEFELNFEYFDFSNPKRMYTEALVNLFGETARIPESEIGSFHHDVANSLQFVLEETLLKMVTYLHKENPSKNLCMAGGVALNCVANGRIVREGPFENVFVQPAAGDAGSALGAAALAHLSITKTTRKKNSCLNLTKLSDIHLGPKYSNSDVQYLFAASRMNPRKLKSKDLVTETASLLADQKTIGWFQGRMEFGPRALGSRSILADPRNEKMRDLINKHVKKREAFRPFAPSVLESHCSKHFDLKHPSPFMLETCQVLSPIRLPSITHVDGSARVQTVGPSQNRRYFELLTEFNRITDCPVLLNTSFNLRGEPIVMTPYDAIWCFVRSDLDALVIEDFILTRKDLSPSWLDKRKQYEDDQEFAAWFETTTPSNVYTFF